jgi:hypothetical protein
MVRPEYDIVDVHAVAVSMAMAPRRIFGPLHGREDGGCGWYEGIRRALTGIAVVLSGRGPLES